MIFKLPNPRMPHSQHSQIYSYFKRYYNDRMIIEDSDDVMMLVFIYCFVLLNQESLNCVIVKSACCALRIATAELEIPRGDGFAQIGTLRDVLKNFGKYLKNVRPNEYSLFDAFVLNIELSVRLQKLESADRCEIDEIQLLIERVNDTLTGREEFTVELDDPSGNSCIHALPSQLHGEFYERNDTENELVQRLCGDAVHEAPTAGAGKPVEVDAWYDSCDLYASPTTVVFTHTSSYYVL